MKLALLYIPDIFFAPRVADALAHLGFTTKEVNLRGDLTAALDDVALLVVQLNPPRETWLRLIETARAANVPVLAFGRHTDAETLRVARQAGAKAVPNSELVSELPTLVEQLVASQPTDSPREWLADFEAAAQRSLETRMRYAFIHTYKPVLDDAPYRSFDSMAEYRRWCEEHLPLWLGYGRI
jgi:hypothetical protein